MFVMVLSAPEAAVMNLRCLTSTGSRRAINEAEGAGGVACRYIRTRMLGPARKLACSGRASGAKVARVRWLVVCGGLLVVLGGMLSPHGAAAESASASAHHQRAMDLYRAGAYEEALRELDLAEELHPAPLLDYNRGLVFRKMGDYAQALRLLLNYLAEASDMSERERREVDEVVADLRTQVGRIVLSRVQPGVVIEVDGVQWATTPLSEPLWANPGQHTVHLQRDDGPAVFAEVYVEAGGVHTVTWPQRVVPAKHAVSPEVVASARPASAAATQVPSAPGDGGPQVAASGGNDMLLIVGWSATGVLLTGAAILGVMAVKERSYRRKLEDELAPGRDIRAAELRTDTLAALCDVAWIAGAALGGLSLWGTLSSRDDGAVAPQVEVGLGSVHVRGRY